MKKRILKGLGIALVAVLTIGFVACSDEEEKHEHTFATGWSSNETTHWHDATCGHTDQKKDQGAHTWNHDDYQYDSTSGKEIRTCTVCSYVVQKDHAHSEDSGTVTTPATCTTQGVKTYKCSGCEEKLRTAEIPAGHKNVTETITKTATKDSVGVISYKCNDCNEEGNALYCGPFGEDGNAATSSSTYIYFGVFPKTVKASTVTVDETKTVTMGPNTYYKGSDGEYYAKVTANPYGSSYTYSDGTSVTATETYFKVEPVKWKVLTNNYNNTNKALLLAEDILTANVPYYNFNSSSNTRTVGEETGIYVNNYKYSQIRAYLNGLDYYYDTSSTVTTLKDDYTGKGFLQTAFTAGAQALIAETTVVNDGASTSDATGTISKADGTVIKSGSVEGGDAVYCRNYTCDNTTDKIFLLSEQEVTTTSYGFVAYDSYGTGNARIRVTTDYAKANHAYQSTIDGCGGLWGLRSPNYFGSPSARLVADDGGANLDGYVRRKERGVVPALSISF